MTRTTPLLALFVALATSASAVAQPSSLEFCQVETVPEEEVALLKKLDLALSRQQAEEVTILVEDLLRRSRGPSRNLCVPLDESEDRQATHFRGFRGLILERLLALPEGVRESLTRGQDAAVRGLIASRGGAALDRAALHEIVDSYPLATRAFEAADQLAELAFEEDDLVAAYAYDTFIDRFHTFATLSWASYARRCLTAARLGRVKAARSHLALFRKKVEGTGRADLAELVARTEAALAVVLAARADDGAPPASFPKRLELLNRGDADSLVAFWKTEEEAEPKTEQELRMRAFQRVQGMTREAQMQLEPPRFMPTVVGEHIYLSNGRRLFVHSAVDGKRLATLPFDLGEAVTEPPPPGMETEVITQGSLVLANLLQSRSSPLVSRRRAAAGAAMSDEDGYASLFLFDASRGHKIIFWEADNGARRTGEEALAPPVEEARASSRSLEDVVTQGHVLGRPDVCGRRIYAAMMVTINEPEVWIVAFDRGVRRGDDLGLQLRPVWATFLARVASSQAMPGQAESPKVFPAVYVSKDKVICQTGTAAIASINAVNGQLEWVRRTAEKRSGPPVANPFGRVPQTWKPAPSREPVRFVERGGQPDLIVVSPPGDSEVQAYDTLTGRIAWATRRQSREAHRFFVTADGIIIRYGARELIALDGRSGKLSSLPLSGALDDHRVLPANEDVKYRGDIHGDRLVLPVGEGWARIVTIRRTTHERYSTPIVKFELGERVKLFGTAADGHLAFTPHGLVYSTKEKLLVYGLPKGE